MDLEGIMLSEVSQTVKDKYSLISLIYEHRNIGASRNSMAVKAWGEGKVRPSQWRGAHPLCGEFSGSSA